MLGIKRIRTIRTGRYTNNRGDDTNEMGDYLNPFDLGTNFNISSIHSGSFHICTLSSDYDVKCWGQNYSGQLGLGDTNHRGDGAGEMGDSLDALELGADFEVRRVVAVGWTNLIVSSDSSCRIHLVERHYYQHIGWFRQVNCIKMLKVTQLNLLDHYHRI